MGKVRFVKDYGILTTRITFALTDEMALEIVRYQRRNKLHTQSETIRRMIERALEEENNG